MSSEVDPTPDDGPCDADTRAAPDSGRVGRAAGQARAAWLSIDPTTVRLTDPGRPRGARDADDRIVTVSIGQPIRIDDDDQAEDAGGAEGGGFPLLDETRALERTERLARRARRRLDDADTDSDGDAEGESDSDSDFDELDDASAGRLAERDTEDDTEDDDEDDDEDDGEGDGEAPRADAAPDGEADARGAARTPAGSSTGPVLTPDQALALERTDRFVPPGLDRTDRLAPVAPPAGRPSRGDTERLTAASLGDATSGLDRTDRLQALAASAAPAPARAPVDPAASARMIEQVRRELHEARRAAQAREGGGEASAAPSASARPAPPTVADHRPPAHAAPGERRPPPAPAGKPATGKGARAAPASRAPGRPAAGASARGRGRSMAKAPPARRPLDPDSPTARLLARVRKDPALTHPQRSDSGEASGSSRAASAAADGGGRLWLLGLIGLAVTALLYQQGVFDPTAAGDPSAAATGRPGSAALERPIPAPLELSATTPPPPPPGALASPRAEVRRDAVARLGHGGVEAVAGLVQALTDRDAGVRERARQSLERLRLRRGVRAVDEIRGRLALARGRDQELLIEGLGAAGPDAAPDLVRVIEGGFPDALQLKALGALGQTGCVRDEAARAAAIALLFSESEVFRAQACVTLGRIGGFAAFPALLERLNDPSQTVRQNAHWALRSITGQGLAASYKVWASWWNAGMRELWERLDDEVRAFHGLGDAARRTALLRLGAVKDPRVVELAQVYLWQPDPELRRISARVLGGQGRLAEPVVTHLIQALPDRDRELAREAHRALVAITGQKLPLDQAAWIRWWQLD